MATEKLLVVCVIEALDHAVAPGFRDRDEHGRNAKVQTQPDDQARGARIAVAAAKTQFVIKEQKIRQAHDFPAAQQAASNLTIRFGALGLYINPMAAKIDDVE